ncbi:hypothetical protein GP486_003983 [Trichoglossum hirsutum]|uniref:Uncharacterized protein n=1 Tax=Trichoglossum hirsutum TaxID=265104 RepID=A0A9P8LC37_9PEZI|nr:hypothetical protein GP486_003983 [Trichoglossum hirsutum]
MLPEQNATVLKFQVGDGSNGITPVFKNRKDLLRFQQLVLGYETAEMREGITAQYQYQNRSSMTVKLEEFGKLQIWIKPTAGNASADSVLTPRRDSGSGILSVAPGTPLSDRIDRRRGSAGGFSSSSLLSRITGGSTPSYELSAQTSTFSIGKTTTASESRMPDPPLLILFLKRRVRNSETLSFLCITLDLETQIDPGGCNCRHSSNSCPTAVIRRKDRGYLSGRRFSTDDINGWNLAIMGAYSRSGQQSLESCKLPNLKIDFPSAEERSKFAKKLLKERVRYEGQLDAYMKDIRKLSSR